METSSRATRRRPRAPARMLLSWGHPPLKGAEVRRRPPERQARGTAVHFAFRGIAWYPPAAAMRLVVLLSALALGVAACAPSISTINARPDKYYQKKMKVTGRVERIQFLPHDTLLEL